MSFSIASFSALMGPPIAGALIKRSDRHDGVLRPRSEYIGAQLWAGCALMFDALLVFVLWRLVQKRKKAGLLGGHYL